MAERSAVAARTEELTRIETVLFDLSGTLIHEDFLRRGLQDLAHAVNDRWSVEHESIPQRFMTEFKQLHSDAADQPFYLMTDMMQEAIRRLLSANGVRTAPEDVRALERRFWATAIPLAQVDEGAIDTLEVLRAAGVRTGIVSYSDTSVFEALISQAGLVGLTDVALCSEAARSCKPDSGIFLAALEAVGCTPAAALMVGDAVDADIVGGNRVGMRTALLTGRAFTSDADAAEDPLAVPDHRIERLTDILGLAGVDHPATR